MHKLGYVLLLLWSCVASAAHGDKPIKMFVSAAFASESGLPVYREIADYVAEKVGRKTAVVSGASYAETDTLLERNIVQVGFVCGLPYIHRAREGKYLQIAVPVSATRTGQIPDATSGYEKTPGKYFSYTIVHKDSKAKSWADLKGKRYAYNNMDSNSGYNMPRYKLVQLGAKRWEDWFSKVVVSGSHEESIRMVARGLVDASSVDSLILDYDRTFGNPDAKNVKIIEQLFPGGAGAPPVVVGSKVDPVLRQAIQDALLNMHRDERGRKILAKALLARFDPPDDRNYDDIRHMEAAARAAGFRDHEMR